MFVPEMWPEFNTSMLENCILEYAKRNNVSYKIINPKKKEFVIKSYADNFLKD